MTPLVKPLLLLVLMPAFAVAGPTVQDACPDVEVIDPETGAAVDVPIPLPEGAVIDLEPKGEWTEEGYYVMRPQGDGRGGNVDDPYGWPDRDLLAECIADIGRGGDFDIPGIGDLLGRTKKLLTDLVCSSINRHTRVPDRRIAELRRQPGNAINDALQDIRRCFYVDGDGNMMVNDNCLVNSVPNPEQD